MTKEKYLIRDSVEMLKTREEKKRKVKEFLKNPRTEAQVIYHSIMSNYTEEEKDDTC